ncbi:MAG TPA: hypothetical protein VJG30_03000 [Candidatus Nanoarchaeia archaeon]|nr:hypothetical protein [Candidatus Nanoarchaeia archaeon]
MTKLTYEDLKLPNYVNSSTAVTIKVKDGDKLKDLDLTLSDVVAAAELAGLNMLFVSDTGRGKTQLVSDIAWNHFGGHDESGNANWADGRPNFEIQELFERTRIDKDAKVYDSDTATQLKEERTSRPLVVVDEINRAPKVKQNEYFDLAEGKYTFRGSRLRLGKDDYALFLATANLNKSNGDFQGTFELDRALINRAHLTIDLDHRTFRPTPEDKIAIDEREADPKLKVADPRDISDRIIAEHRVIMDQTRGMDTYILAFKFIVDEGLNFCDKDAFKEKTTTFPMLCGDCGYTGKDMCSLVKSSSDRTTKAVKALAYGLAKIAELKLGRPVEVDNLDAALQAYKFTTYHGNLNDVVAQSEFGSRKQELMTRVVEELEKRVDLLRSYVPIIQAGRAPVTLVYNANGRVVRAEKTSKVADALRDKGISYTQKDLKTELKESGIGVDWVDAYAKRFKK